MKGRNIEQVFEEQDFTQLILGLIEADNQEALKNALVKIPPFKIAEVISGQNLYVQTLIFDALSEPVKLQTFDFLTPHIQKDLLRSITQGEAIKLLRALSPDDRTALLQEMPRNVINDLIKFLPLEERAMTLQLLGYPEGSVGRLMTPDYISISPSWTVQQVLDFILAYGRDSETISHLFVVDDQGKLLDDIRLRDFLFLPRELKVQNAMDYDFLALDVDSSDEHAVNIFRNFDRSALPVIDKEGTLLGIVTIDDILRLSNEEATEDIQKIGGQEALDEPYMETPFLSLMQKRGGWLLVLFLGEMFTATAMGFFEDEIAKALVLTLFIPLIISSGGNAGSQASTLIIRAMALGEVRLRDAWKVIRREFGAGLFLGSLLGLIGFFRIAIWSQFSNIYGEHWLLIAFTICFSLIGVVICGTVSGATLPLVLRRLGFDPAASSAPFVATIVDVAGVIIYFCIALFILRGTLL